MFVGSKVLMLCNFFVSLLSFLIALLCFLLFVDRFQIFFIRRNEKRNAKEKMIEICRRSRGLNSIKPVEIGWCMRHDHMKWHEKHSTARGRVAKKCVFLLIFVADTMNPFQISYDRNGMEFKSNFYNIFLLLFSFHISLKIYPFKA